MLDDLRGLQDALLRFERDLVQLKATTVTRASMLTTAKAIVDDYFRHVRGNLSSGVALAGSLTALDSSMQSLLDCTHRRTQTVAFRRLVKDLRTKLFAQEKDVLATAGAGVAAAVGDSTDKLIIDTLRSLVPSAALAYEQGLIDLAEDTRLSWRGPATDFREAMRETLDHLAPDDAVKSQIGFKIEPNTNGPTMRQKVRYVLKIRERSKAAIDAVETAAETVDGIVGSFVRSVYTRSSVSTHTPTDRSEVIRVRNFVRVALCELLEINVA